MNDALLIIFTAVIVLLLVGVCLFVLLSHTHSLIKQSFTAICIFMSIWMVANSLADVLDPHGGLLATRIAFASVSMALTPLLIFSLIFPRMPREKNHLLLIGMISSLVSVIVAGLSMTDVVVPAIQFDAGSADVVSGHLYGAYIIYTITMIGIILLMFFRRYMKESKYNRPRIRLVLIGMLLPAGVIIMTNLLLPLAMGSNPFARYSSLSLIILVLMIAISVVRHHLFDIRLATARAVAYILSGATVALFFAGLLSVADSLMFHSSLSIGQRTFYIIIVAVLGFIIPWLKRFYDSLTHRIFLRDVYESGDVLASIATVVAQSAVSGRLFANVSKTLKKTLNVNDVNFFIRYHTNLVNVYTIGKRVEDASSVKTYIKNAENKIIIDVTKGDDSQYEMPCEVILVLKSIHGVLGCITLGQKNNGVAFTHADKIMLAGIAHEVAVATENNMRYEQITQFNETLQDRVNEATDELRQTNKRLRAIDASKDEFISMASHQLRTPLTSIKGYISMLLEGDLGRVTPAQRKALEEAYNSSQRMVYLIGDFLNLSRLQTGRFEIELSEVSLPRLIEEEIAQLRATAQARGVTLIYENPGGFPMVTIDETKIRQVMMNFIDNAIYYSKPGGGEVAVSLSHRAHEVVFMVKDNGIGVSASERRQLFAKFYRTASARKARPDGTGIGLYMAKKVVDAHGGKIIFESKENEGSTFGFSLPTTPVK